MAMFDKEMRHAVEFIPNRLYYVALSSTPPASAGKHFFTIDNDMIYWNFYLDFGPLNLGHVYRYCMLINKKLNDPKLQDKVIYHYSHTMAQKRANAAFLMCAWALLCQGRSAEDAWKPFKGYIAPFPPWHDATPTTCTFNLTILDTLKGMHKAREHKFFDFDNFDIEEYEHYEQVENGDLNWYVYGKFLAFAGPHAEREFGPGGYYTHRPDDYVPYFKRKNVTLVVRLNKPYYDAKKFTSNGIDHLELYFLDGSNPPDHILNKFIAKCEETPGGVAVHCKAGLGRTGTCIAAYIMKHFRLTAEEIIGWMRITRPGSVIGPQQHYLKDIQHRMWRDGEIHRSRLTQQVLPSVGSAREDVREENKPGNPALVPTSPAGPSNSRTTLGVSSARMNKTTTTTTTTMTSPSGSSSITNSATKSSAISMMSSSKTTMTTSPNHSNKTTAASSSLSPYMRPSSRGNSRPSSSEAQKEESGENTQGDLLRIRRQQHLQQSGMHSLNTTTTTSSSLPSSLSPNTSGKSNGSATSGSPDAYPGSGSNTPTASRPRSRLSGFLSSWNK